jgi:hypothetical protein
MKKKTKNLAMGFMVLASAGITGVAVAQDYYRVDGGLRDWQRRHADSHSGFILGTCVGQALAQQGVALPVPERGQAPTQLDATTKADVQAAIQSCIAEMEGNGASPSPSPSPDPSASATTD